MNRCIASKSMVLNMFEQTYSFHPMIESLTTVISVFQVV